MAEANPKVMEAVEAALKKNPDISNAELLEKAKKVDPNVTKLTARQFNATYPLQVKRAMKPRKPARKKTTTSSRSGRRMTNGSNRDRVRKELLLLARDVAGAQDKGEVVDVIASIDRYVDRVIKAAS